jgi:hypothetical protein
MDQAKREPACGWVRPEHVDEREVLAGLPAKRIEIGAKPTAGDDQWNGPAERTCGRQQHDGRTHSLLSITLPIEGHRE